MWIHDAVSRAFYLRSAKLPVYFNSQQRDSQCWLSHNRQLDLVFTKIKKKNLNIKSLAILFLQWLWNPRLQPLSKVSWFKLDPGIVRLLLAHSMFHKEPMREKHWIARRELRFVIEMKIYREFVEHLRISSWTIF
jgi:phage terminase large subunit